MQSGQRFDIIEKLGRNTGEVMNEKIKVLDVPISNYTAKEAMKKVVEFMQTEPINVIEMVTTNTLIQLLDKEEQKKCIEEFELTFVGDKSILEAAGVTDSKYLKEAERLTFVKMMMRFLHKNHSRVFLLAEKEPSLQKLKSYVESAYSGIQIVETATMEEHGKSNDMIVNRINGAEADCIISALPSPLQEEVILRNRSLLNARIWFGLGTELRGRQDTSGTNRLKMFFTQHIVKKKIEKEQKQSRSL